MFPHAPPGNRTMKVLVGMCTPGWAGRRSSYRIDHIDEGDRYAVARKGGKPGCRRALRARDGGRRGRRRRPVLQAPVLGAPDSERRDRPGVRGVLLAVAEASVI